MKNLMKKLILLPLSFVLLVGCGGDKSAPTNNSGNTDSDKWKVSYLYNYEGNEGEFTYQYILDGEKAIEPLNKPTRDGYKFTDWYKDSYCLIPWDFETEVISAPTSIYAGWVEVEDPSKGFDITWTAVEGVTYTLTTGGELPTHVDAYTEISFTIAIADTHEGAPIVRLNGEGLTPVDGVYTFKASTKTTITVTGVVEKEEINGDAPTVSSQYFVNVNGEIVGEMTLNTESTSGALAEYIYSGTFVKDDEIFIVDDQNREHRNWENGGDFIANINAIVKKDGEHTFYLKVYETHISIWIDAPLNLDAEVIRVYFTNPNGWSTVNAYAWAGETPYLGQWPGKSMNYDSGTGYYYLDNIAVGSNIIFNDGGSNQTSDLTVPSDGKTVYTYSWHAMGEDPGTNPGGGTTTGSYALKVYPADGGEAYLVNLTPVDEFEGFQQHFGDNVELKAGDLIVLYDVANAAEWAEDNLNSYSTPEFTASAEGITCTADGTYDFYVKFKWEADEIYIGPANG